MMGVLRVSWPDDERGGDSWPLVAMAKVKFHLYNYIYIIYNYIYIYILYITIYILYIYMIVMGWE